MEELINKKLAEIKGKTFSDNVEFLEWLKQALEEVYREGQGNPKIHRFYNLNNEKLVEEIF